MNNWQPGDLALCVGVLPGVPSRPGAPPKGLVLKVDGVLTNPSWNALTGLVFNAWPSPHKTGAWDHRAFKKIKPDTDAAKQPECVQLLEFFKKGVRV